MSSGPIQRASFINGDEEEDGNAMQRVSTVYDPQSLSSKIQPFEVSCKARAA
jgi:hypothetical protein